MNRSVFSLGLYVFQASCHLVSANHFRYLRTLAICNTGTTGHIGYIVFFPFSQISTWMSTHLGNRFAVQICTTLILKLLHGYFGQLPQNSPLPPTFHTQCLSARALPGRECGKNRNTTQARYLRKSLRRVSHKVIGRVSPDGEISMGKAVKWSSAKEGTVTCDLFKLQDVSEINAEYEVISSCTHSSTCIPW